MNPHRPDRLLRWLLIPVLAVLIIFGLARPAAAQSPHPAIQPVDPNSLPAALRDGAGTYYAPGRVLVARRADTVASAGLLADLNAEVVAPLDVRGLEQIISGVPVTGEILRVPEGQEWDAIARLQADPGVIYAEPDWIVTAAQFQPPAEPEPPFTVDDSLYLERQWYLQRVQASRAWQLAQPDDALGDSVRVAIIDSGVDVNHPEFRGRALPVKSFVIGNDGQYSYVDDCGHGTHIAGLLGAAINNGPGMAGLAPQVVIDPYKALSYNDGCTGTITAVAAAIYKAVDNDVDIINMSVTIPTVSTTLYAAVIDAHNAGILQVGAAGNCTVTDPTCPPPVKYPAAFDEVIAVAATGYGSEIAGYSARGERVELAAPGGTQLSQLYSTWPQAIANRCSSDYQTLNDGGYCNSLGTSFATGLVSGAAALAWSMDRDLTAAQVRQTLKETVTPYLSPQPDVGAGVLNAAAAMRKTLEPTLTIDPTAMGFARDPGVAPFQTTLHLETPSLTAMGWRLTLPGGQKWLSFTGLDTPSIAGSVSYGQPVGASLTISATNLVPGLYIAPIKAEGVSGDNTQIQYVDVQLMVRTLDQDLYLPLIASGGVPFRWDIPNEDGRTIRNVSDISTAVANLPWLFPLGGRTYESVRIYADGFISLPGSDTGSVDANHCLPSASWPGQAIYGWWADLDTKAEGAQVSTFDTDDDQFVVEYLNVPAKVGGYRVSFQIALSSDGQIRLNYLDAPGATPTAPRATVGVEALDGRLANTIYCADGAGVYGTPPRSDQSVIIQPQGVY
jgi:hypothetical protein